jgi:hypothetical protein
LIPGNLTHVGPERATVRKLSQVAALLLGTVSCAPSVRADQTQLLEVSIVNLDTSPGERVTDFQFKQTAAGVYQIERIPIGWHIVVDNDASWNTTIKGNIQVGAAAFNPEELQNFMIVEKNEFGDLHFRLTGVVTVTKDFVKYRRMVLEDKNFLVKNYPAPR